MHDLVPKINNCHATIKFTFNYLNKESIFLDVNIKIKENDELDISVNEKVTNCHQYIKFYHVILFHVNRAFPLARLNVTGVLRRITHVLKKIQTDGRNIFQKRNYPRQVIDEAGGKVFSISMADAIKGKKTAKIMKPTSHTKCQIIISFVCTYNPSLRNI